MKLKRLLLLLMVILFHSYSMAQEKKDTVMEKPNTKRLKYCGFNTNQLLAQFVPFNQNKITSSYASILLRNYNSKNRGYRAGFGINVGDNVIRSDRSIYLSFDFDRRKKLSNKWLFFRGFGTQFQVSSPTGFNRAFSASFDTEYLFGIGWHFGAEYKINNILSLSAESILRFSVDIGGFGGGGIKIDPPVNLMAHFNLSD